MKHADKTELKKRKRPDPYFNPTSIKSEEFSKAFDVFIKGKKDVLKPVKAFPVLTD